MPVVTFELEPKHFSMPLSVRKQKVSLHICVLLLYERGVYVCTCAHRERSMGNLISKTLVQVGVYVCIVYQLGHKSCILVIFLDSLSWFILVSVYVRRS